MQSPLHEMAESCAEIDARTAYTYEAITVTEASTKKLDDAGRWLNGAKTYELLVPRDVPMLSLWSVVLYDNDTGCIIENRQGTTEVNSRQALDENDDGPVRLVFFPKKPDGVPEANWVQTNPKKGFFVYFRWYSPTKAFFDRFGKMENIVEVK